LLKDNKLIGSFHLSRRTSIDTERRHGNLSSAIRLFVLDYYQKGPASPNRSFVAAGQHQAAH
jgi:predicted DNA-binding ribbon-helix-helix protein